MPYMRIHPFSLALVLGLSLTACGDDGGNNNPADSGSDSSVGDSSTPDGALPDGNVPDGGDPDAIVGGEIMVTSSITSVGSPAADADVETLDLEGNTVSTAKADGSGNVTIGAPRGAAFFIWVKPTQDGMGMLRVQPANTNDFTINGGLALEGRADYETRVTQAGQTYDESKGNFTAGINVADSQAGGETVTLGGAVSGSAFVVKSEESVLVQNSVPPLCGDAGEPCRDLENRTEVFFPNVVPGMVTPVVTGGAGTCTIRNYDGMHPVKADTRTLINVDCQ